jgi:Phage integrase family
LPPGITPHSLRHTFTSLLFAIGEDPVSVMRQLGHTDPAFTLRVYAHSMGRGADERERLRALTDGDHGRVGGLAAQNRLFAGKKGGARRIRTVDLMGAIQGFGQHGLVS